MSGPQFRASERPEPLLVRAPLGHGLVASSLMFLVTAGCVAAVRGGWFDDQLRPATPVLVLTAALCAPVGVWFLLRALLRLPLVRVDEHGIATTWTWDASGLVPWEEVRRVRHRPPYLAVEVASDAAVLARVPSYRHRALRRRRKEVGTPVTVQAQLVAPRVEETLTLIHHWRAHVGWLRGRAGGANGLRPGEQAS